MVWYGTLWNGIKLECAIGPLEGGHQADVSAAATGANHPHAKINHTHVRADLLPSMYPLGQDVVERTYYLVTGT